MKEIADASSRALQGNLEREREIYLHYDRPATLEQMRQVVNTFKMPAVHMFSDSRRRTEAVKSLRIFDEDIFVFVYGAPPQRGPAYVLDSAV